MLLVQWHAFNAVLLQSVSTAPGFQNTFLNIGSVLDHCSKISTSPFKKRFVATNPDFKILKTSGFKSTTQNVSVPQKQSLSRKLGE